VSGDSYLYHNQRISEVRTVIDAAIEQVDTLTSSDVDDDMRMRCVNMLIILRQELVAAMWRQTPQ
jgi:hypothetical protein